MVKLIPKIKPKEKKEVLPKRYNQRTYNRIFLGGAVGFMLLSSGAMATNIIRLNAKPKEVAVATEVKSKEVDYRLLNWSSDFTYYYFNFSGDAAEQAKQIEKVNSYYVTPMDIKSQGHVRTPSKLLSSKLVSVTDDTVSYLVSYSLQTGSEEKTVVTEFNIPYKMKKGKYYVSDLPYFVTPSDSKVAKLEEKEVLRLNPSFDVTKEEQSKLDEFIHLFFKNYTTSQDNLDLVSEGLTMLSGSELKTVDFTSYHQTDGKMKAYVQVTFMTAGNTRSENFTLEITEKGSSFKVTKMSHGIK